jgi:hypothetical protein
VILVGARDVIDDHVGVVRLDEGDQIERAALDLCQPGSDCREPSLSRAERTASITSSRELKIATSG